MDRDHDAVAGADALVLVTEWRSYWTPDFARVRRAMRGHRPVVVDARNAWHAADVLAAGLRYVGVGVP